MKPDTAHSKLSRLRRAGLEPVPVELRHPEPAGESHPGPADLGRRLAESLSQLLPIWAQARANPSDPFGGGFGGMSANGTVNDRQGGRNLPVFWSEIDLRSFRVLARHLCDTNAFAIGFMSLLVNYHVRKGYGWQACLKGQKKGGYATQGHADDPLVTKAQNILDAWRDANQWPLRSREAFLRWRRDGEVFGRFFASGAQQLSRFRFVEPEQIVSPNGDTNGDGSFGILTEPDDHETALEYHVTDIDDATRGEWVDAARIIHARANVDSGIKRGVTDFYPLSESLDGSRRLLHTLLATSVKQARVAWIEKLANAGLTQAISAPEFASTATNRLQPYQMVDEFSRAIVDQFGRFGIGGQQLSDVRRVEGSRQFEAGPTSSPTGYIEALQAALRGCAQRWNMPESSTGDASNNNFASSLVANSPFLVTVEGNQLGFGLCWERPVALKVLEFARDAGLLSWDEWRRLDVETTEPAVATPDPLKDTQVYTSQLQSSIVSLDTVRQKLGYDPRHEAEAVAKDKAAAQPAAPAAPAGPIAGPIADPFAGAMGEGVEWYSEAAYAMLAEADRSHLVRKKITRADGHSTWVWVNPDKGKHAGSTPKPKSADHNPTLDAETAVSHALNAPHELSADHVERLAQHLDTLPRDRLKEIAKGVNAKVGGLKRELVQRLLDHVGAQTNPDAAPGAALARGGTPAKRTSAQPDHSTTDIEALGKELDAAYAATRNPPESADYAALRAKRDELEQRYKSAKQRLGAGDPPDPTNANRAPALAKEPVHELTPQQSQAGGWSPIADTNRDGKLVVHAYRASAQVRAAQYRAAKGVDVAVTKHPDGVGYIVLSRNRAQQVGNE